VLFEERGGFWLSADACPAEWSALVRTVGDRGIGTSSEQELQAAE
jgi:hypothetical protein